MLEKIWKCTVWVNTCLDVAMGLEKNCKYTGDPYAQHLVRQQFELEEKGLFVVGFGTFFFLIGKVVGFGTCGTKTLLYEPKIFHW